MRIAAIDVGTNTTRLLVAEGNGSSYRDLDRRLAFTRLGEGVDSSGRLTAAAIKRTLSAIAEYCSICGEFGVQQMKIAGTSAVRDAANRETFLSAVEELSGAPAVALSGEDEARLSFWGATADLAPDRYLVCDIGGGSTEFVLGVPGAAELRRVSLDLGSVRLTERFLKSDPPGIEEIILLEAAIDEALTTADAVMGDVGDARLVGLGGTITTLAAIHLGLEVYKPEVTHGALLTARAVNEMYQRLARTPLDARASLPMLPKGRADVIVAGGSILSRTMAHWGLEEVRVSEKDILDGLVLEMLSGGMNRFVDH